MGADIAMYRHHLDSFIARCCHSQPIDIIALDSHSAAREALCQRELQHLREEER